MNLSSILVNPEREREGDSRLFLFSFSSVVPQLETDQVFQITSTIETYPCVSLIVTIATTIVIIINIISLSPSVPQQYSFSSCFATNSHSSSRRRPMEPSTSGIDHHRRTSRCDNTTFLFGNCHDGKLFHCIFPRRLAVHKGKDEHCHISLG